MNKFTLHKMLGGKATIQIPELTPFSAIFRWTLMAAVALIPQMVQAQWHATVGAQGPEKGHQALAFLPNEIWIHAGDSITWTFDADEIHTVTFLQGHQIPERAHVAYGTIWPKPRVFHVIATAETMARLSELMRSCASPELANVRRSDDHTQTLLPYNARYRLAGRTQ